jgi:hypothetical protein
MARGCCTHYFLVHMPHTFCNFCSLIVKICEAQKSRGGSLVVKLKQNNLKAVVLHNPHKIENIAC